MLRLFLDANVVIDGILSRWSASHCILTLCARQIYSLVLSQYVINEIESALLDIAITREFTASEQEIVISEYIRFINITKPEIVYLPPDAPEINQARIIRHVHDVPVLAAAIKAKPDWLLSLNRKHFSDEIAGRLGLQIATPAQFFKEFTTRR